MSEESKKLPTPPEVIYLIPGDFDGYPSWLWCEDPAPGQNDDPADAVKYYRHAYVEQLEARNAELEKQASYLDIPLFLRSPEGLAADIQAIIKGKDIKIAELQAVVNRLADEKPLNQHGRLTDSVMEWNARIEYAYQHATE